MKKRHMEAERVNARAILQNINASVGQDFFTLSASQVSTLLKFADLAKYQKPRHANGSRGRYFYALVQRRAQASHMPDLAQIPRTDFLGADK